MSSPAHAAQSLIRTVARTFFSNSKHAIMVDLILSYKVLHLDELALFFSTSQPKELRSLLNPLVQARLVSKGSRAEVKIGQTTSRAQQREYYYINFHEAIDAIKYKLVRLREKVEALYKEEQGKRKDWNCPRCKAEYDELEILSNVDLDGEGFFCARCKTTLVQNEAAVRERGNHEKIRRLNDEMKPFDRLIAKIDRGDVPPNDFETAWATKRDLPKDFQEAIAKKAGYMSVEQKNQVIQKAQATVDAGALETTIADERTRAAEEAEARKVKQEQSLKQNQLPAWHNASAIGKDVKREGGGATPNSLAFKMEENEDRKFVSENAEEQKMQDDMDAYMAEMERERKAQELKAAEESEDDDGEEDDFEDIPESSAVGTPASSQPFTKQDSTPSSSRANGLKRERDPDADSYSGTSTGANTPMHSSLTSIPEQKRVKLEGGSKVKSEEASPQTNGAVADSEEEDDFEDV